MSLPSIFPTLEPSLPFLQSPLNLQDLANHFYFCNTFPSKLYLTPFLSYVCQILSPKPSKVSGADTHQVNWHIQ